MLLSKEENDNGKNNVEKDMNTSTPFLKINESTIYFNENWDVGIGGGLWSNGLSLSKFFIDHPTLLRRNLGSIIAEKKQLHLSNRRSGGNSDSSAEESSSIGIRAIELGSGNGLLSCCFAAVAGDLLDSLFVTDLADHVGLMKQTVLANSHILELQSDGDEDEHKNNIQNSDMGTSISTNTDTDSVKQKGVKCHVLEHAWGEFESSSKAMSGKFDFIFGSDVAYRDFLHEPLITSLLQLSDDHTISIIGVTMTDTKPIFFANLKEAGFRYERIPDHLMSQEFRGTTFGLFVIQRNRNKH